MNSRRTAIRWDYELVLRETAGVAISFDTLERGAQGSVRDTSRATPFERRLEPRGQLRLAQSYWIRFATGATPSLGTIPGGREGIMLFLRFHGKTEPKSSIKVDVHFRLYPGSVVEVPAMPEGGALPPSRRVALQELSALSGQWRGILRDDMGFDFPVEFTVKEDGSFEAAVGAIVKQRFEGALGILPVGQVTYNTQVATGSLTLHEGEGRRVLVGDATPRSAERGAMAYALRLEARTVEKRSTASPTSTSASSTPARTDSSVDSSSEILTNQAILEMVKAGLDESVILLKIKATPARFDTRTDALILLKQAGVSDRILSEMISK